MSRFIHLKRGRPPFMSTEMMALIRHYRACDCNDERIMLLTGATAEQLASTPGAHLLSPQHVDEMRSRPGSP